MKGTSLNTRAIDAIKLVRAAFGSPGDFGYDTAKGKALQALFDFYNAIAAERTAPADDAPLEERLAELLAEAIDTPLLTLPEPASGGRFNYEIRLYSFLPEVANKAADLLEEIGL